MVTAFISNATLIQAASNDLVGSRISADGLCLLRFLTLIVPLRLCQAAAIAHHAPAPAVIFSRVDEKPAASSARTLVNLVQLIRGEEIAC